MLVRKRLRDLRYGDVFTMDRRPNDVLEARGNCWYGIYSESYNGGPWIGNSEDEVCVEEDELHPSQRLSCFI